MNIRHMGLLLAVPLLALAPQLGAPALAQSQRCFAETQLCIAGPIRAYWERNGGLATFGYPITPLQTERVESQDLPVQWFERDRLEDHGAAGVMAGRLGAEILEWQGRAWQPLPAAAGNRGCRYFPETQHSVCQPFLSYWERNGGLARFGYPLTEGTAESAGNWYGAVQYFERRRMEYHEEFAGTRSETLLGLLGRAVRDARALGACAGQIFAPWRHAFASVSFRGALGCPQPAIQGAPGAVQPFEHGSMLWVDLGAQGRKIYVLPPRPEGADATLTPIRFQVFDDTWAEGQPVNAGLTPPGSLLEPQRGFGKVWREHPEVRARLGWAFAPESPAAADYQPWSGGGALLWFPALNDTRHGFGTVFALAPGGGLEMVNPF
ncbi:MAG TPA: hypothetical protein PKK15_22785 [Kouleothrix sp.]|nr:hypothetical protein [Kouleothrix sp.]